MQFEPDLPGAVCEGQGVGGGPVDVPPDTTSSTTTSSTSTPTTKVHNQH